MLFRYFVKPSVMTPRILEADVSSEEKYSYDSPKSYAGIMNCPTVERSGQTVVSDFDGTLLRSRFPFPYYMLLALEAGSPFRAFLLLLLCPFIWASWHLIFQEAFAIQIFVFVSTAGLRFSEVAEVSKAVLPKFFLEDLNSHTYRVFISCGKRYVVTSYPRIMVEYTLKTHMGVDQVFGTELEVTRRGYCTGLVSGPGVMLGEGKADTVKKVFGHKAPDVGIGSGVSDYPFLSLCKKAFVDPAGKKAKTVPRDQYLSPLVFHDGRLVRRPTPMAALAIFLWIPIGVTLAWIRIIVVMCLPMEIGFPLGALLGCSGRMKGAPPLPLDERQTQGDLYACSHRSVVDGIFVCLGLRRKVRGLIYSVSRISEMISVIKNTRLTRNREEDAKLIEELLKTDDLIICPEGTTCREPYLLRFSSLFAELTEHIAPAAVWTRTSMFHGTSARGFKSLDVFFLLMNPRVEYEVTLFDRLPMEDTVAGGKTGVEVAKLVQKLLSEALGYTCTELSRRDKYMILAGNDGTVKDKRYTPSQKAKAGSPHDNTITSSAR